MAVARGQDHQWPRTVHGVPGALPLHDLLDAEVLVTSGFGNGRLELTLLPDDLDGWARGLDMLAAGHDICWIDDDRSPEIRVLAFDDEQETPAVRIEDVSGSNASMFLPICLDAGWIDDQRRLLQHVRREWPREVQRTSLMAYEWRR